MTVEKILIMEIILVIALDILNKEIVLLCDKEESDRDERLGGRKRDFSHGRNGGAYYWQNTWTCKNGRVDTRECA